MKITTIILLISSLILSGISHAQQFDWVVSEGSINLDEGHAICTDTNGNIFVVGSFVDSMDFDPGPGNVSLYTGGKRDIFVQKLDEQGNLLWAKAVSRGWNFQVRSFELDPFGNLVIAGIYQDSITVDLGVTDYTLISNGSNDHFILKVNPNGDYLWAKSQGGTSTDFFESMTIDKQGNIISTGSFTGYNIDFDPGPGIFTLSSVGVDIFIQKLDTAGNLLWVHSFGGVYHDVGYSIVSDDSGNVYSTGTFNSPSIDFDPGPGAFNLTTSSSFYSENAYVLKLNSNGDFVWARKISEIDTTLMSYQILIDKDNNLVLNGYYNGLLDFDPGPGVFNLPFTAYKWSMFTLKLNNSGDFLWVTSTGPRIGVGQLINLTSLDHDGFIYNVGRFEDSLDLDPGLQTSYVTSQGSENIYIQKLDPNGNLVSAKSFGGSQAMSMRKCTVDANGNLILVGNYFGTVDFDPNQGIENRSTNGSADIYVLKLSQNGVMGWVYNDFNQDCIKSVNETGIGGLVLTINPGNMTVTTNSSGLYFIDSLPVGTYTVSVDTSLSNWIPTCPVVQTFTVNNTDAVTAAPDFGLIATYPCHQPNISIVMPQIRRGFVGSIYVQACNESTATNFMDSAYCIVELPTGVDLQSASRPFANLGNNTFYFYLDTLFPGDCTNFYIEALVNLSNQANSTLCVEAQLYPQDSCVFDTTYNSYSSSPAGSVSPCTTAWDNSSLMVEGYCVGDSVRFVIYNTGDPVQGDMTCFAPVRVYVDGQFILLDSIQLAGGDSIVFMFEGNGSTWILQADQHPLHPGNSNPNAHVENCGTGTGDGTGVVIQFPNDDADPVIDIYCGQVTAPLDPNDKTGFPGGLTSMNYIEQNQRLEYLIRFQNVGTDTAVNVVIRDTLSTDLNIFTVVPEVASHDYTFRMYGHRILEWTFTNIMLPDSNVSEAASNGFVKFRVDQVPNLPFGTVIENSAAIYFDFEAPVITNTYFHTIHDFSLVLTVADTYGEKAFDASLYPNPTTSFATLSLDGLPHYEDMNIQVYDMAGRQAIPSINASSQQIPIDVSSLSKGMYLIQVQQQGYPLGILKLIVK